MDVGNASYSLKHVPVTYSPAPVAQVIAPPQPAFQPSAEDFKQVNATKLI